jgi:hypothetical protein
MTWVLLFVFLSLPLVAMPIRQAPNKKTNQFFSSGVVIGGEAGKGFSLLNVRRYFSKKVQTERIVLDLGDLEGHPLTDKVSYFSASLEKAPSRLVLDLAQVQTSGIDEPTLRKLLRASPLVQDVTFIYDPEDQTTSLVLQILPDLEAEIFTMASSKKPSRIVVDLRKTKK